MRVTRVGKMFNHKGTEGEKGVFDISRSKFYRDFVLTDPADPNIPDTDIPRLRLVHLGGKSVGVDDDDTSRVVLALQDFYASKAAHASVRARRKCIRRWRRPPTRNPPPPRRTPRPWEGDGPDRGRRGLLL